MKSAYPGWPDIVFLAAAVLILKVSIAEKRKGDKQLQGIYFYIFPSAIRDYKAYD
jgi:hypothetical protein